MASFKALCLAGVASLVATVAANAADLLPPPPPVYAPPPPPVSFGGGWYIRGDTGIAANDLRQQSSVINPRVSVPGLRYEAASLDDSALADAGVGYRYNQYFRGDVTVGYQGKSHYSAIESYRCVGSANCRFNPRGVDYYSGNVRVLTGLANAYVSTGPIFCGLGVFAGASVGVANVAFGTVADQGALAATGGFGFSQTRYTNNLAYGFTAGVEMAVTQNVSLELAYRYMDMGSVSTGRIACQSPGVCPNEVQRFRLTSNNIRLGVRYTFADLVPAWSPSMPLVRKY